jgi:hypothetical protein
MHLNLKLKNFNNNMRTQVKLYGYRRFFVKRIAGAFIIELTIAFALFRGAGTLLAVSKIYKIIPKDQHVSAQSMQPTTYKHCLDGTVDTALLITCY